MRNGKEYISSADQPVGLKSIGIEKPEDGKV